MVRLNWFALFQCQAFSASSAFLHQSRWNITMDVCCSLNPLIYSLYWSGGISGWLAALSNLTCKLEPDVRILSLSCKSCWETSVSCSLCTFSHGLHSVDGAMLFHKCSGGPSSSTSMSSLSDFVYLLSFVWTMVRTCL